MNDRTLGVCTAACVALLAAAPGREATAQNDETTVARPCLEHYAIRRTRIVNDRNIAFVMKGDEIYLSELPRQCPSLQRGSLVNYAVSNRKLCAGGQFQVLWQTGLGQYTPAFTCQLGAFVPITADELELLAAVTDDSPDRRRKSRRNVREAVTTEQVELPPRGEPAAPEPPAPPAE